MGGSLGAVGGDDMVIIRRFQLHIGRHIHIVYKAGKAEKHHKADKQRKDGSTVTLAVALHLLERQIGLEAKDTLCKPVGLDGGGSGGARGRLLDGQCKGNRGDNGSQQC